MPHSALAENNTLLKTSSENRDRFINPACVRHQHCYIFNLRLTLHSRLHHVSNRLLTYRITPQIESGNFQLLFFLLFVLLLLLFERLPRACCCVAIALRFWEKLWRDVSDCDEWMKELQNVRFWFLWCKKMKVFLACSLKEAFIGFES